jgi:hypothetical protein
LFVIKTGEINDEKERLAAENEGLKVQLREVSRSAEILEDKMVLFSGGT